MNILKLSKTLLKREYKSNIFYATILTLSISLSFIFINISNDKLLVANDITVGYGTWDSIILPLSKGLPFVIVCICWMMIFYATNYYLNKKVKEYALLFVSGCSSMDITKYVLYQVIIILIIVIPLSFLLGIVGLITITKSIYVYLNVGNSQVNIYISSYIGTIISIIFIFVWITIIITGFFHRNSIKEFLDRKHNITKLKLAKSSTYSLLSLIFYIFSLLLIGFQEYYIYGYIFPTILGIIGMIGIIKNTIPLLLCIWKNKIGISKRILLISMSNFCFSIQGAAFLIGGIMILIVGIIPVLISQDAYTNEFITGVLCYFVITVLLIICISFKLVNNLKIRVKDYDNLMKLGYIKWEIKKIIRYELIVFYFVIIFMPSPLIILILLKFISYENFSITSCILLIACYIIPIIISAFITYKIYLNNIFKRIGEAINYEK